MGIVMTLFNGASTAVLSRQRRTKKNYPNGLSVNIVAPGAKHSHGRIRTYFNCDLVCHDLIFLCKITVLVRHMIYS